MGLRTWFVYDNGSYCLTFKLFSRFDPTQFDELLLRHASKCGATVIEETSVTEVQFESKGRGRPVSVIESDLDRLSGDGDEEAKTILSEINARKPIHKMYNATDDFGSVWSSTLDSRLSWNEANWVW